MELPNLWDSKYIKVGSKCWIRLATSCNGLQCLGSSITHIEIYVYSIIDLGIFYCKTRIPNVNYAKRVFSKSKYKSLYELHGKTFQHKYAYQYVRNFTYRFKFILVYKLNMLQCGYITNQLQKIQLFKFGILRIMICNIHPTDGNPKPIVTLSEKKEIRKSDVTVYLNCWVLRSRHFPVICVQTWTLMMNGSFGIVGGDLLKWWH